MNDAIRADVADELEAPRSPLCDCDAVDNPPTSPETKEPMAHHCECRAVLASEVLRRGMTRTRHARACSPFGNHVGEGWPA